MEAEGGWRGKTPEKYLSICLGLVDPDKGLMGMWTGSLLGLMKGTLQAAPSSARCLAHGTPLCCWEGTRHLDRGQRPDASGQRAQETGVRCFTFGA